MSQTAARLRGESAGFARFCLVGALGFAADAGGLLVLIHAAGLSPFLGRAISLPVALTVTWALHRAWTFRSRDPDRLAEWGRFLAVNGVGGGLNYLAYSATLIAFPGTPPLIALTVGSGLALAANYLGARLWAFR